MRDRKKKKSIEHRPPHTIFVVKISISRSQQLRMVEGERILFNKEYNIYRG